MTAAKTVGEVVRVMGKASFDAPQCMSVLLDAAGIEDYDLEGAPMHYDT